MLIKYTGKYVNIYFIMKITYQILDLNFCRPLGCWNQILNLRDLKLIESLRNVLLFCLQSKASY